MSVTNWRKVENDSGLDLQVPADAQIVGGDDFSYVVVAVTTLPHFKNHRKHKPTDVVQVVPNHLEYCVLPGRIYLPPNFALSCMIARAATSSNPPSPSPSPSPCSLPSSEITSSLPPFAMNWLQQTAPCRCLPCPVGRPASPWPSAQSQWLGLSCTLHNSPNYAWRRL